MEELLRRSEFAFIDFRDSPAGSQAYVQGSSLAVWEVVLIAQSYEMDVGKTAVHLEWPAHRVRAALLYAEAFAEEIDIALKDNEQLGLKGLKRLQRMLPQTLEQKGFFMCLGLLSRL